LSQQAGNDPDSGLYIEAEAQGQPGGGIPPSGQGVRVRSLRNSLRHCKKRHADATSDHADRGLARGWRPSWTGPASSAEAAVQRPGQGSTIRFQVRLTRWGPGRWITSGCKHREWRTEACRVFTCDSSRSLQSSSPSDLLARARKRPTLRASWWANFRHLTREQL
jgi:hypothetical protein